MFKKSISMFLLAALAFNLEVNTVAAKPTNDESRSQKVFWEDVHKNSEKINELESIKKADVLDENSKNVNTTKKYEDIFVEQMTNTFSNESMANVMAIDEDTTEETETESTDNNTADTAYYLDESYLGITLSDVADTNENWYYFYSPENCKISAIMQSPSTGDYDLYLYYLEESTLNLVGYSTNSDTAMESTSFVGSEGYYFLRFVPYSVSSESTLQFRVDEITTYDASEPDDNVYYANAYTDSIAVSNTIDNTYDKDWVSFTVNTSGTYAISLLNVPSGCQYFINLYDSNLTSLGGLLSSGSNTGSISLDAGTYYFYVASYDGTYSTSSAYTLKVSKRQSSSSKVFLSRGGKLVEVTSSAVYIDQTPVTLSFSTSYFTPGQYWIHYSQELDATANSTIPTSYASHGNLKGSTTSGSTNYTDCLEIYISNCSYWFYARPYGGSAEIISETFGDDEYITFYIDLNSCQVVDSNVQYLYTMFDHTYTFTKY